MPERWLLPGRDPYNYWVILGKDGESASFEKSLKQLSLDSFQSLLDGWLSSDLLTLQDIYKEVKKGSKNVVVPDAPNQLRRALLQEFQKKGVLAFEVKFPWAPLPPVTVRAAYTGAVLRPSPGGGGAYVRHE